MRDPARVVVTAVLLSLGVSTCVEGRRTVLRAGDLVVRRVAVRERATREGGVVVAPGDYVLESERFRVVVGGLRREGEARGAVLEASLRAMPAEESVVLVAPRLYVGERAYRVTPGAMYVVERDGRPVLRIDGVARVRQRVVDVSHEMAISRLETGLAITTRIATTDERPLGGVRVGLRVAWGGGEPFVPGIGPLADESWHEASWIGNAGRQASTTVGFQEAPLRFRGVYERHGQTRFLSYTELVSPLRDVGAHGAHYERSIVVSAAGGLAQSVRRLGWARGRPFPEVLAVLPNAPDGARIQLLTKDERPVVIATPDVHGRAIVPLSPVASDRIERAYVAMATAYGHAPSDHVAVPVTRRGARIVIEIPKGGHIRIVALDTATGARIPARARILGVGNSKSPELGPDYRASGAGDSVVTADGEAIVPVETGTYRVIVTHGPEWTLADQTVEVTETFRPDVRAELTQVVKPGDWVGCDFHVHSSPSYDSQVTLEDRLESLVAEGVRFAVPTDHNHVTDYAPVMRSHHVGGLSTLPGVEVTTWDPNFGHFNAFPYPIDTSLPGNGAPRWLDTTAGGLFAALRAADPDMVVQVNHPRLEGNIGYFDLVGLDPATGETSTAAYSDDFDAIEVWNGFDLARPDAMERVLREWLGFLARGHRVVATGNSDSHQVRYQWAGYPRTYVRVPDGRVDDPRAVVRALKQARVFVSSGPFLEVDVAGHGIGEIASVERSGTARVHIRVRAPAWMDVSRLEVYVGAEPVLTELVQPAFVDRPGVGRGISRAPPELPVVRYDSTIDLHVGSDTFVVVIARGERPMDDVFGRQGIPPLAFSNPVWLDGDGDGRVNIGPRPRPRRPTPAAPPSDMDAGAAPPPAAGAPRPAQAPVDAGP